MEEVIFKDALTAIAERKSVRHFSGQKVKEVMIDQMLRAAMAAPAAIHLLPWKFIVITHKDTLLTLSLGLPFAKMIEQAGVAIVVCAEPSEAAMGSETYAIIDCSCASENILIAAEALGLGAVWTAVYPNIASMDFVRKTLLIPQDIIPLNIIPIGIPTGEEKAEDKYDPKNIHWQKW